MKYNIILVLVLITFSINVNSYVSIELIRNQGSYNVSEIHTFRENGTQFDLPEESFIGNFSIYYEFSPLGLDRTEFSFVICKDDNNIDTLIKCILTNDSLHSADSKCTDLTTAYASSSDVITVDVKMNGSTPLETFRKCGWYSSYANHRLIIYHPTSTIYDIDVEQPPIFNLVSYISSKYTSFMDYMIDIILVIWDFIQIIMLILAFTIIPTVGIVTLIIIFRKIMYMVKKK